LTENLDRPPAAREDCPVLADLSVLLVEQDGRFHLGGMVWEREAGRVRQPLRRIDGPRGEERKGQENDRPEKLDRWHDRFPLKPE
jgi:hypothetical protein